MGTFPKVLLICVIAICTCGPTSAADYYLMGSGNSSCASWLENDEVELVGASWLMGFWSGMNAVTNQLVGSTTDSQGRLAEVKMVCVKQPSKLLVDAAIEVYISMRGKHSD